MIYTIVQNQMSRTSQMKTLQEADRGAEIGGARRQAGRTIGPTGGFLKGLIKPDRAYLRVSPSVKA